MEALERIENVINRIRFINGNVLKIIALITMTIDHIGAIIFPDILVFRIVGRISFPLFAYLIAEGCFYTRSRKKYLISVLSVGIFCQLIFWIFQRSLYQCVLVTFAISIMLIFLMDYIIKKKKMLFYFLGTLILATVFFISEVLPALTAGIWEIDYGFIGILTPVIVYVPNYLKKGTNILKYLLFALCLVALTLTVDLSCQAWCMLSLIFIALYNGKRGRLKLKYFFYAYYPIHLGIIYLISML